MNVATKLSRWAAMASLVAASLGASAMPDAANLVWVDNQSFGFDACAGAHPTADDAAAAMGPLRARAAAAIENALRARGVELNADRFVLLTPVSGALACQGAEGQVTFRVSAVDRRARSALTVDMPVRTQADAADRTLRVRTASELARHFGSTPIRSARL